jgi:hypothetical protein
MWKQGIRSTQLMHRHRIITFGTTSTQYHHYATCRDAKAMSLLTHQIYQIRNSNSTALKEQQWRIRLPIHYYTQCRFMGVNPYDDDEDEDTTEPDLAKSENEDTASEEEDEDEDEDDRDYDESNSDDDESIQDEKPIQKIKNKIPEGPVPGPIKFQKTGQETFFQFDYRNVPMPDNMRPDLAILLQKIQIVLKNTELEPYFSRRGCETLRSNIENLPDGTKFRVGGGKKSTRKVGEAYNTAVNVTTHRALRKSMSYLLWERHAIVTSGRTHDFKKLSSQAIGQSLLGPETRIPVDQRLGKEVIEELWTRGVSSKYNRLIKRHNDRSADGNYLKYLRPPSRGEVARMDWNTDLNLPSNERTR